MNGGLAVLSVFPDQKNSIHPSLLSLYFECANDILQRNLIGIAKNITVTLLVPKHASVVRLPVIETVK